MAYSLALYFRPIKIEIDETVYTESEKKYKIRTIVRFFSDEEMTQSTHDKEYVFDGIEYSNDWDWLLAQLYQKILEHK